MYSVYAYCESMSVFLRLSVLCVLCICTARECLSVGECVGVLECVSLVYSVYVYCKIVCVSGFLSMYVYCKRESWRVCMLETLTGVIRLRRVSENVPCDFL